MILPLPIPRVNIHPFRVSPAHSLIFFLICNFNAFLSCFSLFSSVRERGQNDGEYCVFSWQFHVETSCEKFQRTSCLCKFLLSLSFYSVSFSLFLPPLCLLYCFCFCLFYCSIFQMSCLFSLILLFFFTSFFRPLNTFLTMLHFLSSSVTALSFFLSFNSSFFSIYPSLCISVSFFLLLLSFYILLQIYQQTLFI